MHHTQIGIERALVLGEGEELPLTNPNGQVVFNTEIAPLVNALLEACDKHNVPMFALFETNPGFSMAQVQCKDDHPVYDLMRKMACVVSPGMAAHMDAIVDLGSVGADLEDRTRG